MKRFEAGVGLVILLAVAGVLGGGASPALAKQPTPPKSIRVEFALTASRAQWVPSTTQAGAGRLTLTGIAPRMAMMAAAPSKLLVTTHASLLGSNWKHLFRRQGNTTNAIVSARVGGKPTLIPVRIRMTGRARTGARMVFRVTPLRRTGHRSSRLGTRRRTLEDPTLLVDPVITDGVKALWASLMNFFADEPAPPTPPPNPVSGPSRIYDNAGGTYAGPDSAAVGTESAWRSVTDSILRQSGAEDDYDLTATRPDVLWSGGTADGVALFSHSFGNLGFYAADGVSTTSARNVALFDVNADRVQFNRAEVAGANLRALVTDDFLANNTAFERVDLTGAALGSFDQRSIVSNAVFSDVTTSRAAENADGTPDAGTRRGAFLSLQDVDFSSVSFQDADFAGAEVSGTTFQGCGFQRVDFSGASIVGDGGVTYTDRAGAAFQELDETFGNSILDDVSFDGARLTNVSFAGVDLSKGVSFDGAVLANVDFTGAVGLQDIDWSRVRVEGPVYGLERYGTQIGDLGDRGNLRSLSFDGVLPNVDPGTGFDVQPDTGYLIDPATGVRLAVGQFGGLVPIDPSTGQPMRDPDTGGDIQYTGGELIDPSTGRGVEVDYGTGVPDYR